MVRVRPKIFVSLPVLDELRTLPVCLACLAGQTLKDFEVVVCVNQPDSWWDRPQTRSRCERNQITLDLLREDMGFPVRVLDRSSRGRGWAPRRAGVGAARRALMDLICREASDGDVIVSLDADAVFGRDYLGSLAESFRVHPDACAVAVPFFHPLAGKPALDRAILRYEIYLRYHALNLWRIRSPYAFTALGSALAFRVGAYRAVKGVPQRQAGEDFYLLQKMCKHGRVLTWNPLRVYPSPRASDRVPFGTGPAVLKGMRGDFGSSPIFAFEGFDDVGRTTERFVELFHRDVETPLDSFLRLRLSTPDVWGPLRRNYRTVESFVRACHGRLDGLRILQYLRWRGNGGPGSDGRNLARFLHDRHLERLSQARPQAPGLRAVIAAVEQKDGPALLEEAPVEVLDAVRRFLAAEEESLRKRQAERWAEAPNPLGTC